jgi:molybdate transport system permease protein
MSFMKVIAKSHSLAPFDAIGSGWSSRWSAGIGFRASQLSALLLLGLILAPLLALAVTLNVRDFFAGLTHPSVGAALALSAETTAVCLFINVLAGTPLAWHLARSHGWMTRAVEVVLQLPIVMPPAVAGVGLMMAFGRQGLFGSTLLGLGIHLPFTATAVLVAQIFVSAPLYVRSAIAAFKTVEEDTLRVARTLGGSAGKVLLKIAIPSALPGLFAGCALSWARALGEFGATLMFAGNLTGRTQTLPLLVYETMESDLRVAQSISLVLVGIAAAVLVVVSQRQSLQMGQR